MDEETHVLDLLPAYALGSLDADESQHVRQHLLSCAICRAESDSLEAVTAHLALAAPLAVPPAALKDRLLERVRSTRPEDSIPGPLAKRPLLERLLPVWGVASLVLILLLSVFNLSLWQRLNRLEYAVTPGGMRAIPLTAVQPGSAATGFVLVSADGNEGALVVDGLPPLGEGWQYQVWLVRDGERTSGAIFSTDEDSYGGMRIRVDGSLLEFSAVDVTIEPAGGSPQPTGEQVLAGQLFAP